MKDSEALKWIYKKSIKILPSLITVTVCNALLAAFVVYTALLSRGAVDGAVSKSYDMLFKYGALLFFAVFAQFILRLIGRRLEYHINARLETSLTRQIFVNVLKKDYLTVTGYHSGEIMNRLTNDVNYISGTIANLLPQVTSLITRLVLAFGALCALDISFALIFVIAGLFVFIVSRLFRRTMKRLHKNVQAASGLVRSFIQESFENLLIVKTFGIENKIDEKTKLLSDDYYGARMRQAKYSVYASSGISLLFSLGYIYAIIWGASGIYRDIVTFGTLTAVLQLVNQVQMPFSAMSGVMTKFYSTLASAERLIELEKLCEKPAVDFYEPDRDFEYIEFKNVSFKYDRETVLEDINLRINRGELVLVSGISGIGKSTLLKLLLGVLHPGEGEINLKINSGKTVKIDSGTRGMFAYVPQGNLLLSGTIRENLMLVNENAAPEELERAIGISCAIDFIETLPDGLDTIIGERGQGLSEGQIQRLAIARAVLSGAPILLLDEATSALDEETEKRVLNNIMALNDVTCLLISHKNAARGICGREYCIENRRIRESESAKNENL